MNVIRKMPLSLFKYNFCGSIFNYNPTHVNYASEISGLTRTDSVTQIPAQLLQRGGVLKYNICSTAEIVCYLRPALRVQGILIYMLLPLRSFDLG